MLVVLQQNIQCKGMLFIRFLLEHVFLVIPTKLKLLNCSTISKHCHLKIRHINPNYQNMREKKISGHALEMLLIQLMTGGLLNRVLILTVFTGEGIERITGREGASSL